MIQMRRTLAALLAGLLMLSLSGCGTASGGASKRPAAVQTAGDDFQKNMHQSTANSLRKVCETEDGLYFQWDAYAYPGSSA